MGSPGGDGVVTAAVLIIGDEILSGRTQDTNLRDIARYLGVPYIAGAGELLVFCAALAGAGAWAAAAAMAGAGARTTVAVMAGAEQGLPLQRWLARAKGLPPQWEPQRWRHQR
jgi:hypothetical protein